MNKIKAFITLWGNKFEFNRAVFFGLLTRGFDFIAGPISIAILLKYFTVELQGYYYTFLSIVALQSYLDIGLGNAMVQFASHEWANLKIDSSGKISGTESSLSRLASLLRLSTRWYAISSALLLVALSIGGYLFFSSSAKTNIHWLGPWLSMCVLASINFLLIPLWGILEGCNQVKNVYTFYFIRNIFGKSTSWIAMILGAQLWAIPLLTFANLIIVCLFLYFIYGNFIKSLISFKNIKEKIYWHKDIWPYQWRIGFGGLSSYFSTSFFVPVLFKLKGPVIAGQMGITWTIAGLIGTISSSWLNANAPKFGMLVSQKRYSELDALFWKVMKIITGVGVLSIIGICILLYLVDIFYKDISGRFLPLFPLGCFMAAQYLISIVTPFTSYLRAHKKEPTWMYSISSSLLIGLCTYMFAKYSTVTNVAISYLVIMSIFLVLILRLWGHCRTLWHSDTYVQA